MRSAETEVSFEDFVRARTGSLLRTALLLTGQRAEAEDLVQIALERAYRHWPGICRSEGPERYVRTILARASAERWRRLARRPERAMPAAEHGPVEPDRTNEIADRDYLLRRWPRCRRGSARCWCCGTSMTFPRPRPRRCSGAAWAPSRARRPGAWPGCASRLIPQLPCPPAKPQGARRPKAAREGTADD